MSRLVMIAVLAASGVASQQATAQQSIYTQNQLNSLTNRNSTAAFTADRIRSNLYNSSVPITNFSQANRNIFSGVLGRSLNKPFSGAGGGGSVSPWLSLTSPYSSSADNYYTQVRPQLDQQRYNQQMANRNQMMQRQLNSMAARPPYNPVGDENRAPTGHGAAFMNYGGYYPQTAPSKNAR
jgi:hypothetical protein